MPIDFDTEIVDIISRLKQVEGYMDCEKAILQSIKTLQDKGFKEEDIDDYLEKLSAWFQKKIKTGQGLPYYTNYRFAAGFVNYLLK